MFTPLHNFRAAVDDNDDEDVTSTRPVIFMVVVVSIIQLDAHRSPLIIDCDKKIVTTPQTTSHKIFDVPQILKRRSIVAGVRRQQ